MGRKGFIRVGLATCVAGLLALFRETVFWILGKFLDWITVGRIVTVKAFATEVPWVNLGALCLVAIGVFLSVRGARMQEVRKRETGIANLASRALSTTKWITRYRATNRIFREDLPPLEQGLARAASLLISFEKAGFLVPKFGESSSAEALAVGMQTYFMLIGPLLADGHADTAREEANEICSMAEAAAASFRAGQWWTVS